MKTFKNLKLSNKFSLTLLLLLLLPVIVIFIIVTIYFGNMQYKKACDAHYLLVSRTCGNVENFTNDGRFVSINILSDESVQKLLKSYTDPEMTSHAKQSMAAGFSVQPLLESRDTIKAISLFDDQEIIFQYGLRVQEENEEYLKTAIEYKGRPYWTSAYIPKSIGNARRYLEGDYVVSLIRAVNDMDLAHHRIGFERITYDEAYIESLYSGIKSEKGSAYIVNRDGFVISSSDKSLLGQNLSDRDAFQYAFSNRGWVESNNTVCFFAHQNNPDWALIVEEPKSVFAVSIREISILMFFVIGLILLFGLLFLYIQNKTIIKPVSQLSKDADNYREGNYNISNVSDSSDEIGQLNKSLMGMSDYIKNLIERDYKSQLKQREIELDYLQSQINPHFLYNTLDNIRWMAKLNKQEKIVQDIEALSDVFRHSLNSGNKYTTVEDEVKSVESYILLQKSRFEDSLDYSIYVNPVLNKCKMMNLIIQPLVENAIVHGIEPKNGKGIVKIIVEQTGNDMICEVTDNGVGIDVDAVNRYIHGEASDKKSFALRNIQERIILEYGDSYGLSISKCEGGGTRIVILLPMVK